MTPRDAERAQSPEQISTDLCGISNATMSQKLLSIGALDSGSRRKLLCHQTGSQQASSIRCDCWVGAAFAHGPMRFGLKQKYLFWSINSTSVMSYPGQAQPGPVITPFDGFILKHLKIYEPGISTIHGRRL